MLLAGFVWGLGDCKFCFGELELGVSLGGFFCELLLVRLGCYSEYLTSGR